MVGIILAQPSVSLLPSQWPAAADRPPGEGRLKHIYDCDLRQNQQRCEAWFSLRDNHINILVNFTENAVKLIVDVADGVRWSSI